MNAFSPTFKRLLVNTLVSGVTSSFMWFALTFWVYLETHSVVATGIIGGSFSLSSALIGPVFGTFVDRHRKHTAMRLATAVAVVCFSVATTIYVAVDNDALLQLSRPWFWLLVASTLVGAVAAQMRGIALSTTVNFLVPEDVRDRANGMVGTVTGISFAITSVFSGLVVGGLGMGWAYGTGLVLMTVALVDLGRIRFSEPEIAADAHEGSFVDVRGAVDAIRSVPGLSMLVGLSAFNNLLGGVFMALLDPYGLSLVSVETWGLLFGGIMFAFIGGGMVVAKRGLGSRPLRVVVGANLAIWTASALFTARSSIVLLAIGLVVWLAMIPAIEAGEQTVLQRSIPFERQGRVFGFAQLVENAAAPVTAFLMAPLAEAVFMPTMTDGAGADLIGGWFGTGPERGLALMFTLAGITGIVVTLVVRSTRSFRRLDTVAAVTPTDDEVVADAPTALVAA